MQSYVSVGMCTYPPLLVSEAGGALNELSLVMVITKDEVPASRFSYKVFLYPTKSEARPKMTG